MTLSATFPCAEQIAKSKVKMEDVADFLPAQVTADGPNKLTLYELGSPNESGVRRGIARSESGQDFPVSVIGIGRRTYRGSVPCFMKIGDRVRRAVIHT